LLAKLRDWFDHRTGYRKVIEALLIEHIPGGARWRYVWGSVLATVFLVQLVTGVLLMTAYSPGDATAWGSVYFIQYEMDFGWLIRGLHHFGSQTMVVLLGVHMLQVVIAGAHLPPREVNWWLGLMLLGCVLGLSLTGYLLPWDQKGYWATQVATNIAANVPGIGPGVQKLIVGGPAYGHHTLTRFFTLHVGVLPPLVIVLIIAHLAVFRRHGVTTSPRAQGEGWFWPDQAFRDMAVSMAVFIVMLLLACGTFGRHGHALQETTASTAAHAGTESPRAGWWHHITHGGRYGRGANLDAPADPSSDYPARPEWYFLFLFQLLKYFEGPMEIVGTVLIPTGAAVVLLVLPLLGYGRMRPIGHAAGIVVVVSLLCAVATLTYRAIADDTPDQNLPELTSQQIAQLPQAERPRAEANERARAFRKRLGESHEQAKRAIQLAAHGIPADGAVNLLRRDPMTAGPKLFVQNCAGCHRYNGKPETAKKASDLAGFGTEQWIGELVNNPDDPRFFGYTKLRHMSKWAKETLPSLEPEGRAEVDRAIKWLAGQPSGLPKEGEESEFAKGYEAFAAWCLECHRYEGQGGENIPAPDFTRYGSADWVRLMMMSPDHPLRYGERNAMPVFRDLEGPSAEVTKQDLSRAKADSKNVLHLGDVERELIIRWLTGDGRVVFGGDPITAPRKE
jgi:ubiquinol-cytochrome c reductase cytochrome b subunit